MTPVYEESRVQIFQGHALDVLQQLPDHCVHATVCSPPYFGLRRYSVEPVVWPDGWRGHLGLEPTPELFIAHLVQIFREVRRVLHSTGTCWVVISDSFAGGSRGSSAHDAKLPERGGTHRIRSAGLGAMKPKDLYGIPWMLAFALRADGWWLRSAIPWVKFSAMPESVQDRPSVSHETVFLFSKGARYFWDQEAIRRPLADMRAYPSWVDRKSNGAAIRRGDPAITGDVNHFAGIGADPAGRNRRTGDWWVESLDRVITDTEAWLAHAKQVKAEGGLLLDPEGAPLGLAVNPQAYAEAHFATFPPDLIRPMIQSGTSEHGCCAACLAPWERVVARVQAAKDRQRGEGWLRETHRVRADGDIPSRGLGRRYPWEAHTCGWQPSCRCDAPVQPCVVLDMFAGSGTTVSVARDLQRRSIGIELSPQYIELITRRLRQGVLAF